MRDLNSGPSALLRAGKSAFRPTAADRERVLESLAQRLAESAPPDQSGQARAGHGGVALHLPRLSLLLGGAAAVALLIGGAVLVSRPWSKTPPRSTAAAAIVAASAPLEPSSIEASSANESVETTPTPVERSTTPLHPSARAAARPSGDSLAEEVRLLSLAEEQWNGGRSEDALVTLREHERRFPKGALTEDRLAVRVEVLCALGRFSTAKIELHRLARAFPSSAHLASARTYCGDGLDAPP